MSPAAPLFGGPHSVTCTLTPHDHGPTCAVSCPCRDITVTDSVPAHDHEQWMIRPDGRGGTYCAACGDTVTVSQPVKPTPPQPTGRPSQVVVMSIISGGTVQQVTDVLRVDHRRGRVLVRCHPDTTPRWVSLAKPRTDNS